MSVFKIMEASEKPTVLPLSRALIWMLRFEKSLDFKRRYKDFTFR
jgi:hypothetical protein